MFRFSRVQVSLGLALVGAAIIVSAGTASAQNSGATLKPDLSKIYGREGTSLDDRRKRALDKLYNERSSATTDPKAALRLKDNRDAVKTDKGEALEPGPDIGKYSTLDANRDGTISQDEYLSGRDRTFRPSTSAIGSRSNKRQQLYNERLQSQFRGADTNRDGRISKEELKHLNNPRF